MSDNEPYAIVGIIDAYGAIHHRPIYMDTPHEELFHEYHWPQQTHKRWRFTIADWKLDGGFWSKEALTIAEKEDLCAFLRRHYKPPLWVLQGEEWDALGRPHSGAAYEKHIAKWEKIMSEQH